MAITGTTEITDFADDNSILNLELEINNTINYLIEQRNGLLEGLNDEIKENFYVEDHLINKLKTIIKFNRQIRTLEAGLIIFREFEKKKNK